MVILSTSTRSSPECRTIQINGKQHYLWRAVDQDGEVVDVFLQARRDGSNRTVAWESFMTATEE